MKQKLFFFTACLLTASLLLSGCQSKPKEDTTPKPIQIALTQDILSFDPMMTSDIFSEAVLRCVYTSLFDFDENLKLRPKLVKNVTIVDDCTWQIEIHNNVTFHDGTPLTADDVVFSIERARLGGRTKKPLEVMDSIKKVDDTTFLISTKEPYSDFLSIFAKAETSIVSKKTVETPGYDFSVPVGSGPFTFLTREEGTRISLKRFDDYFLEKAASPYLDFLVIVTEQERTAAFLNENVDILFSVSAYDCEKLKLSKQVNLLQAPSTKIEYLSLNTLKPPMDNPKVRLAISYAINRENISSGVYHSYSTPFSGLIPQGITGYTDSPITYNPQKAKELLAEAGYADGFEFTVITIDTIRKNTMEYIKLDLAEIGIMVNYNLLTMKEAAALMTEGGHESILVGWAYNPDPNGVLPLLLGTGSGKTMNSSNYSNPIVDDLIAKGRAESDPNAKKLIYEQINEIVTMDAPIIVLQNPMILCAALNNIEGVSMNAQGLFQYETLYRK